jgi:hypothetical protein
VLTTYKNGAVAVPNVAAGAALVASPNNTKIGTMAGFSAGRAVLYRFLLENLTVSGKDALRRYRRITRRTTAVCVIAGAWSLSHFLSHESRKRTTRNRPGALDRSVSRDSRNLAAGSGRGVGRQLDRGRLPVRSGLGARPTCFQRRRRRETSSQILGRIKADTAHRNDLVIIWAGNNNFYEPEQVEADIAEAIQTIAPRHFFVLTIVVGDFPDRYPGTSNYAAVKRLNGDLLEKYRNNVIDISSYLNALYDPTVPEGCSRSRARRLAELAPRGPGAFDRSWLPAGGRQGGSRDLARGW